MSRITQYASAFTEYARSEGYNLFLTINPRLPTSETAAYKKFVHFFENVNKYEHFFNEFIRTIVFFNKNEDRTGVHIHSLIKGIDFKYWSKLKGMCFEEFGQSEVKAVHDFVAEYLLKKDILNQLTNWTPLKIRDKSHQMTTSANNNEKRILT